MIRKLLSAPVFEQEEKNFCAKFINGFAWSVVGLLILGVFVGGVVFGLGMLKKSFLKATVKKYELTQKQQRDTFGRSSRDRTAAQGSVEV